MFYQASWAPLLEYRKIEGTTYQNFEKRVRLSSENIFEKNTSRYLIFSQRHMNNLKLIISRRQEFPAIMLIILLDYVNNDK